MYLQQCINLGLEITPWIPDLLSRVYWFEQKIQIFCQLIYIPGNKDYKYL